MDYKNKTIIGDCYEILKLFPDDCIDMVITSPPYWRIRNYDIGDDAIGSEKNPDDYIARLAHLFTGEVNRILKSTGSLYIIIASKYYGNSGFHRSYIKKHQRKTAQHLGRIPTVKHIDNFRQDKQLILIPELLADVMVRKNWILRNRMIWVKGSSFDSNGGQPNSPPDRYIDKSEETILLFRKSSKAKICHNKDFEKKFSSGQFPGCRLNGSIVLCPKERFKDHPASFPENLIAPFILTSSKPGHVILDTFGGSGTTAKVAKKLGRCFCSIEKSEKFHNITQQRVEDSIQ